MVERPTALRLGILVFDGVMMSSIAAPSDALRVADKLAQLRFGAAAPAFRTELIHARGSNAVMTSSGMTLSGIVPLERDPDVLLIPGVMHGSAGELLSLTAGMEMEIALIRSMHLRGVRVAGSCTGTFLLAMSGLLDGRPATTSWWLAAAFRQAFPLVELQADELVVESGEVTTAGGASAVLDFVLRQIARVTDAALAQQTAKLLLVDPAPEPGAVRVGGVDRKAAFDPDRKDRENCCRRKCIAHSASARSRRMSAPANGPCCAIARPSSAKVRWRICNGCGSSARRPCSKPAGSASTKSSNVAATPIPPVSASCSARDPSHAGRLPRTLHAARALAAQRRLHQICTRVASGRTIASPALQPNASAKPSRLA